MKTVFCCLDRDGEHDGVHEGRGGGCHGDGGEDGADGGVVPDDSGCVTAAFKPASRPPVQRRLVKKRGVVPDGLADNKRKSDWTEDSQSLSKISKLS